MEDPNREPSVIIEDSNTNTNQELGRGRPVSNSAATDLLKTIQQLRADRKQQRGSNSALRERERLFIELETQKFEEVEEGLKKFLGKGP